MDEPIPVDQPARYRELMARVKELCTLEGVFNNTLFTRVMDYIIKAMPNHTFTVKDAVVNKNGKDTVDIPGFLRQKGIELSDFNNHFEATLDESSDFADYLDVESAKLSAKKAA